MNEDKIVCRLRCWKKDQLPKDMIFSPPSLQAKGVSQQVNR